MVAHFEKNHTSWVGIRYKPVSGYKCASWRTQNFGFLKQTLITPRPRMFRGGITISGDTDFDAQTDACALHAKCNKNIGQ